MGLDMYLQRSRDVEPDALSDAFEDILSGVIYWRKANAIHKFFCDNGSLAADGTEDVGYYLVEKQTILNIIERIDAIISDKPKQEQIKYWSFEQGKEVNETVDYNLNITLAEELLPTESGFFFGDTDYNYWYYADLVRTSKLLKQELAAVPNQQVWFYYASW
jgi:hypothetical protein